jgi:hypothetical protein
MFSEARSYLTCLFFFKVAVGAVLLAIGWDALTVSSNPFASVSLIMALSFAPAAFARPLFKKLQHIATPRLLTGLLFCSGILILIESMLIHADSYFLYVVHFILWIAIFLVEVATEKWFVTLSHTNALQKSRKLSGISTSVGQIGVICGPLAVMAARLINSNWCYLIIFLSFLLASITAFQGRKSFTVQIKGSSASTANSTATQNAHKKIYILCFALIWPTLTIFNISIPVLAKSPIYNSINVAGLLEILIGAATASAGLLHGVVTNVGTYRQQISVVCTLFIMSLLTSYFFAMHLWVISISIFLLGLSFGYLRVELRAYLSRRFPPSVGGEIIAAANSWSAPLVIIYSLLLYLNINYFTVHGLAICFPLAFFLCAAIFVYVINAESRQESI